MSDEKFGAVTQNDRQAAIDEFRKEYNISPNAEQLIRANGVTLSQAVKETQLLPIDHNATAELNLDSLKSKTTVGGSKVSDLGVIKAAAVRGNAISLVIETPDGHLVKDVVPFNDDYVAPREPAHRAAAREQSAQDVAFEEQINALRAEMAADLADHKRELEAKVAEQIEGHQEQAAKSVARASEDAAKAEQKAQTAKPTAPATGDSSDERGGQSSKQQGQKPRRGQSGSTRKSGSARTRKSGSA